MQSNLISFLLCSLLSPPLPCAVVSSDVVEAPEALRDVMVDPADDELWLLLLRVPCRRLPSVRALRSASV